MNDRAGFELFYQAQWLGAYRLASLLVQDPGVGEEIAQEAFLELWKRWDQVAKPERYLKVCLINRSKNWSRTHFSRKEKLKLLPFPWPVESNAQELSDELVKLSFRQRAVVVLRYYAGYSEAEIADYLGCKPGTVKSLSNRALRNLKEVFDES